MRASLTYSSSTFSLHRHRLLFTRQPLHLNTLPLINSSISTTHISHQSTTTNNNNTTVVSEDNPPKKPNKPSKVQLPPRPTLPDSDLKHVYLKGSGPGGQKINKTSSAVQLTHLPTGLVVKSQATRSQKQNHTIAKRILAEKIELMEKGSESRAAKKVELAVKKKKGAGKKARRKYRRLAEGKDGLADDGDGDGDEELDMETENRPEVAENVVGVDSFLPRKK